MQANELHWKTTEGIDIEGKHWQLDNPTAAVCLLHGLGEHTGRYHHVAAFFAEKNIATLGADCQGHGRSGGKRGHAPNLDSLLREIDQLLAYARLSYPGTPVFLYGHSMGGNLALNYLLRKKPAIAGVVATGSWIRLPKPPAASLVLFAKIMNGILPTFTQSNGLNTRYLSKDSRVVDAYNADPLVHDRISVALGLSMLEAAAWLDRFSGEVPSPLLLMHGSADHITDPQGSTAFAQRASGNITCRCWDGLYHEIHHEPEQQAVLGFLTNWIKEQCSS